MLGHANNRHTRREVLQTLGVGSASLLLPLGLSSCDSGDRRPERDMQSPRKQTHIVTLSYDDGFRKSSLETAEIYEKYGLSACINVIATAHRKTFVPPNEYQLSPAGDFGLWNELQARGHEIMPHSYKHANLTQMPLPEAKDLVRRCLDVFSKELRGFDPAEAVYNFAYNASTPELETWLTTQVKAFRTGGNPINPLPHKGQTRLTCTSFGPGNIDAHLTGQIDNLLSLPSGWLIYNTHGLDEEGWGPVTSTCLERLLARLIEMDNVAVLPAGKALSLI